jgi:hypothetical protein
LTRAKTRVPAVEFPARVRPKPNRIASSDTEKSQWKTRRFLFRYGNACVLKRCVLLRSLIVSRDGTSAVDPVRLSSPCHCCFDRSTDERTRRALRTRQPTGRTRQFPSRSLRSRRFDSSPLPPHFMTFSRRATGIDRSDSAQLCRVPVLDAAERNDEICKFLEAGNAHWRACESIGPLE